jgi:hypothetical protein
MEEQKRKRLIRGILIAIAVLIIAIAVLLWLLMQQTEEPAPAVAPEPAPVVDQGGLQPVDPTVTAPVVTPEPEPEPAPPPDGSASLRRLAMAFAERYGSYSNESDFENLLDLQALMTQSMAAQTESFVQNARASFDAGDGYAGTVTRALTAELDGYSESAQQVSVTVKTQRRDSTGSGEGRVYYQELVIDFVKDGDSWKASQANWGEQSDTPAE